MSIEHRKYKRYPVGGTARFRGPSGESTGEVLDVGTGGILVRCDLIPPSLANLAIDFTIDAYRRMFVANGRVLRTQLDVMAIMFLEEVEGLTELLSWLDQQQQ